MIHRAQQSITIRSDRAARRLALLTCGGRSPASVIEEALERMPLPPDAEADLRARIEAVLEQVHLPGAPFVTEFDAREYDEICQPQ